MKNKIVPINYDESFKEVLTFLTIDCMKIFLPEIAETIDFTKKIEFLEQELIKNNHSKKITDKLIKFVLLSGETQFIFVHIEIEAHNYTTIAERMFEYYMDLRRKYQNELILGLILYVGDKINENINKYDIKYGGFGLKYFCPYYSFAEQNEKDLFVNKNPVAIIILAVIWINQLKNKGNIENRLKIVKKVLLILKKRKINKIYLELILNFITKLLSLSLKTQNKILKETNLKTPIMYENIKTYQQAQEIWAGVHLMTEEGKPLSKYVEESELKGKLKGELKGKLKGELEAKLEIAKNLLANGFDIKKVAELTKLTIKQISKIIVN